MKESDKILLLKDLCNRLPYGVKVTAGVHPGKVSFMLEQINPHTGIVTFSNLLSINVRWVKPYLRDITKLTKKELDELEKLTNVSEYNYVNPPFVTALEEYYNSHHIDYHFLIQKGLALEAPENMYENYD